MRHIVIVGGGFAGIRLARNLRSEKDIWVTLVSKQQDFRYCPALYRAATGKKMGVARLPLEWMLLDIPNLQLVIGTAQKIDPKSRLLTLESGEQLNYDEVVFATGVVSTYFNIEGLDTNAYGMKSPEEVVRLRAHLHETLLMSDAPSRNYVVIGGGPTGVELAAGLGQYLKTIARRHRRSRKKINIWLVEGAPRLLPTMNERAGKLALKHLNKLGVKVKLSTRVTAGKHDRLETSGGPIPTHAIIWTAGVQNNPIFANNHEVFKLGERGKVTVNKRLEAKANIYVIGDNAATKNSGLALSAIWHANFTARDIKRQIAGKPRKDFKDRKPIQIVPVGDHFSILQWGKLNIGGLLPAILRRFADYFGYADLLGPIRALTVWRSSDILEIDCSICLKRR